MSNARYVQVNVGRNISGTPMTSERWERFLHDVAYAMIISARSNDYGPFSRHEGTGSWQNPDGSYEYEDSAHVSFIADIDAHALRIALKELAEKYGQDAIALILGSELISS